MHVLQLGPYPPPHGGVQSNIVAIRRHLLSRGARASTINLTRFHQADGDDVHYPRGAVALLWLLLRLRCDVIHLHIGGNLTTRLLALGVLCTWKPRANTVLTFHSGGFPSSSLGRAMRRGGIAGRVLRRFDRLIAVNQEIADFFVRLGCDPARIHCIRPDSVPAVDAKDLATDPVPSSIRDFLATHDPVLVTVGQLEPEYDLPLQIELMGRLVQRHPQAGLVIIGPGSLEAEMQRLVASRPWATHITLCRDVPHAATLRLIEASRMLLRTTHYDGDSVSVREALHFGTPVIASDNGMRPAGVRLVPARDIDALDAAVNDVLAESAGPPGAASAAGDDRNIALVADVYRELTAVRAG